eukprot:37901-Chlamydomonas_euryale.AAC.5
MWDGSYCVNTHMCDGRPGRQARKDTGVTTQAWGGLHLFLKRPRPAGLCTAVTTASLFLSSSCLIVRRSQSPRLLGRR